MRFVLPGIAFTAALLLASGAALAQHGHRADSPKADAFDEAKALAASQAAIGRLVAAGHAFRNTRGETVKLSAYRGRPVVLSLVYTSCEHTCPMIAESIARAVEAADAALDRRGYSVLTIGFDTKVDTPPRMRLYQSSRGLTRPGWDFLSADAPTVERLAAETGFYYTARAGGFDHLAQVTLIDGEGRIYRQIYGENFPAEAMVEPLKQLIYGQREDVSLVSTVLNRVRLLCTVYDPKSGRYEFSYAILFEIIIGAAGLGGVLVFAIRLWRQTKAA